MSDNRPIGVFDSGLGGLTAVAQISKELPNEKFIYFGDTARTPYGSKSANTIKKFAMQITDFLVAHDVKCIVIACNTVSAICLQLIRDKYVGIPVLGIIEPTAQFVAETINDCETVGIIGTKVTVESKQYEELIHKLNKTIHIKSKACPLFVPLIEEGIRETQIVNEVIKYYLDDFIKKNKVTDLILGCTHYPLFKGEINTLYPNVKIINPSQIIAKELKRILERKKMISQPNEMKNLFYASDLSEGFISMISRIQTEGDTVLQFKSFEDTL